MKRMRSHLIYIGIIISGFYPQHHLHAQRFIVELDNPNFMPFPMAVPDAISLGQTPNKYKLLDSRIADVMRSDLDISEAFSIIPRISYLAPKSEPWTNPHFPDWLNVGASGLIRIAYRTTSKDTLKITFRLYDVIAQREILVKHHSGKVKDYRNLVHAFSEELYQFFTGKSSIFLTKLIFVGNTPGAKGKNIYITDFDGSNLQEVIANSKINIVPTWNNDGSEFYFTSYKNINPDLYSFNLQEQSWKVVSDRIGQNVGAAVSPDGKKIAFTNSKTGSTEIYLMDKDGSHLVQLTNHWSADLSPSWNHDGSMIAFVSSRSANPQIYVMEPKPDSIPKRLTMQGNYNTEPDWSPTPGGPIVFSARDEYNQFDIFTVDPETREITRLTQDQGNNESPSYSPDGRHIVFVSTRGNRGKKVYIMNSNGTNQRLIVSRRGEYEDPAWSPFLH